MPGYSRKDDWKMNNDVKVHLVKRWIDVSRLKINTTKGFCHISGELLFTDSNAGLGPEQIAQLLKDLNAALMGIPRMRDVQWDIKFWKKTGTKWDYTPDKKQQTEDEKKMDEV